MSTLLIVAWGLILARILLSGFVIVRAHGYKKPAETEGSDAEKKGWKEAVQSYLPKGAKSWARIVILIVALGSLLFIFNATFPRWAEAYAKIGGPVGYLLLGMVLVGVILAAGLPKTAYTLGSVLGAVVMGFLIVALFYLPSCPQGDTACWQQVAEQERQKREEAVRKREAEMVRVYAQRGFCDNIARLYRFETTRPALPFNPGASCSPDIWHKGHCIYVQVRGSAKRHPEKICHKDGVVNEMPENVEFVWSADEPFSDYVQLSTPRAPRKPQVQRKTKVPREPLI